MQLRALALSLVVIAGCGRTDPVEANLLNAEHFLPEAPVLAFDPTTLIEKVELRFRSVSAAGASLTYTVWRGRGAGGPYDELVCETTASACRDLAVVPGSRYAYVAYARNRAGTSPGSNEVSAIPMGRFAIATALAASESVTLTWGSSVGADAYVVAYGRASGLTPVHWSAVATSPATVTDLDNAARYYFRVLARNATGTGPSDNEVAATPVGPGRFQIVDAVPQQTAVLLRWTPSTGAQAYAVRYGTTSQSYPTVASVVAASPWVVGGLTPGTLYCFMVTATAAGSAVDAAREACVAPGSAWALVGQPGGAGSGGRSFAFALSSTTAGRPVVVSGAQASAGVAMAYSGGAWGPFAGPAFSDGNADHLSMAVAPQGAANAGVAYVSFEDRAHGDMLTVVALGAGGATPLGAPGQNGAAVNATSIAVDADGNPWVAWRKAADGHVLLSHWNGGGWDTTPEVAASGMRNAPGLALDRTVTPNVPYVSGTDTSTQKLSVRKLDGGAWAQVGQAQVVYDCDYGPQSIVVDGAGVAWVAYADSTNGCKATVASNAGGDFAPVGGAASPGRAWNARLAVAPGSGALYLAYLDVEAFQKVTVLKLASGAWQLVGAPGFTELLSQTLQTCRSNVMHFAVDADGTPMVAVALASGLSVYAHRGTPQLAATALRFAADYPASAVDLPAIWAPSAVATATEQELQLYADEVCATPSGEAIDLAAPTVALFGKSGAAGQSYTYRILTSFSDRDPVWSACSEPASLRPTLALAQAGVAPLGVGGCGSGSLTQVVFDHLGRPYVIHETPSKTLGPTTVVELANGLWRTLGQNAAVPTGSTGIPKLAFDKNGVPYALNKNGGSAAAKLTRYDRSTGVWSLLPASDGFTPIEESHHLAIHPLSNLPVVGFVDVTLGVNKPSVMIYDGVGAWSYLGAPQFSANPVGAFDGSAAMILDAQGVPYFGFMDAVLGQVFVMRFDGGGWDYVGTSAAAGISTGSTRPGTISMALDPTLNLPVVAYSDGACGGKLTVQRLANDAWSVVGSACFTGSGSLTSSQLGLAVDTAGTIWVSGDYVYRTVDGTFVKVNDKKLSLSGGAGGGNLAVGANGDVWLSWQDLGATVFAKRWRP
ncbi:MAG: hypothetical protein HY903_02995 [Deltaproteobacteria bacterium]|nr:hypothetical protein [Deltaproteobacteria bacterium]